MRNNFKLIIIAIELLIIGSIYFGIKRIRPEFSIKAEIDTIFMNDNKVN